MGVYVDAAIWPFRRMIMCHMIADTEAELHEMADTLNIPLKYFQNERYPHYDICKSKRARALRYGAKEIGREEFVARVKLLKNARDTCKRQS